MIKRRTKSSHSETTGKRPKYDEVLNGDLNTQWHSNAGMITRVLLKNFMCHGELDYRPTERLNFLHGSNGSGKSAVLSGIVFALGGGAKISNRGTSNKGFIRSGQNSASVEITLRNEGEDSYRPDVYGKSISIIRTITKTGAGGYKIKDSNGKIVCDKKVREELDRILENFGIQVDNPIAILNQDAAKTFLFKCDPSKLYEFFMRATQLEDCKKDYNTAAEEKNVSESLIREKLATLPDIKKEVHVWEKKYQFHQTLENKKDTIKTLKTELAWAMSKQAEMEYEKTCKEVTLQSQKIEKAENLIQKERSSQRKLESEKAGIEKEVQDFAKVSHELENVLDGYKENLRAAKDDEKKIGRQLSQIKSTKATKIQELKVLTDAIQKARDTDEDEVKQKAKDRANRIQELTSLREEYEAQMQSTQTHVNNLSYNISTSEAREKELKRSLIAISNEITNKQRELKNIQNQRDNKLVLFGDGFPKLVAEIEKNYQKFKVPPIGPLGAHMKLSPKTTPTEAKLIEYVLRNLLRTFIADNFEDKRLLDRLANRCGLKITIITSKFRDNVYDVSDGRCESEQFDSIFDRLEFDDPNVANCVIDQAKIEQILLIKEDLEAQQILKNPSTTPNNCLFALTSGLNQYYPSPYRSYALDIHSKSRPILQTSVDEMEEGLHQEIKVLQDNKTSARRDLEANQNDIKGHHEQRRASEKICRELRPKIATVNMEIQEIKDEADTEKSPDISALEEDKEKLEEDIGNLDSSMDRLNVDMEDAKVETKRFSDILVEKTSELKDIAKQTEPLRERLENIDNEINTVTRNETHYKDKVKEYTSTLEEKNKTMEQRKEKFEKQKERAESFSKEPVDTKRKAEVVFRELQVTEESIKRAEKSAEPKELVDRKYREVRLFFNNLTEQIECLKDTVKYLDSMLRHRKKGFIELRGSICRLIGIEFALRLRTRKYRGELSFNHQHNELNIYVDPNSDVRQDITQRDMKTLSGGEKSYSTISLVLSLWAHIHPPFRILDEFDVFMDSLNRRIALDQIINYAKETRKFQYVFLTPLGLENLKEEKEDVNVVYFKKNEG